MKSAWRGAQDCVAGLTRWDLWESCCWCLERSRLPCLVSDQTGGARGTGSRTARGAWSTCQDPGAEILEIVESLQDPSIPLGRALMSITPELGCQEDLSMSCREKVRARSARYDPHRGLHRSLHRGSRSQVKLAVRSETPRDRAPRTLRLTLNSTAHTNLI